MSDDAQGSLGQLEAEGCDEKLSDNISFTVVSNKSSHSIGF